MILGKDGDCSIKMPFPQIEKTAFSCRLCQFHLKSRTTAARWTTPQPSSVFVGAIVTCENSFLFSHQSPTPFFCGCKLSFTRAWYSTTKSISSSVGISKSRCISDSSMIASFTSPCKMAILRDLYWQCDVFQGCPCSVTRRQCPFRYRICAIRSALLCTKNHFR